MGEFVMDKILILGASGLVGRTLIDEYKDEFDLYGTYHSSLTSLVINNSIWVFNKLIN
jgi:dTDP-4-dehydrorhamnose reductase